MSIEHMFKNHPFNDSFQTHNAVLDVVPFNPEVLIIGTFNPRTALNDNSDFFYSRNYFWPAFENLFVHNSTRNRSRRDCSDNQPDLETILGICSTLRVTFADLIVEVLHRGEPDYQIVGNDVLFNHTEYNLISDNHLDLLNIHNQVHWGTQYVIEYISQHPTIESVYFTRRPIGIWATPWNAIAQHRYDADHRFTNIFTPSGQGLAGKPRMAALLRHWLHNDNPNFGTLEPNWLAMHGVDQNNFI